MSQSPKLNRYARTDDEDELISINSDTSGNSSPALLAQDPVSEPKLSRAQYNGQDTNLSTNSKCSQGSSENKETSSHNHGDTSSIDTMMSTSQAYMQDPTTGAWSFAATNNEANTTTSDQLGVQVPTPSSAHHFLAGNASTAQPALRHRSTISSSFADSVLRERSIKPKQQQEANPPKALTPPASPSLHNAVKAGRTQATKHSHADTISYKNAKGSVEHIENLVTGGQSYMQNPATAAWEVPASRPDLSTLLSSGKITITTLKELDLALSHQAITSSDIKDSIDAVKEVYNHALAEQNYLVRGLSVPTSFLYAPATDPPTLLVEEYLQLYNTKKSVENVVQLMEEADEKGKEAIMLSAKAVVIMDHGNRFLRKELKLKQRAEDQVAKTRNDVRKEALLTLFMLAMALELAMILMPRDEVMSNFLLEALPGLMLLLSAVSAVALSVIS